MGSLSRGPRYYCSPGFSLLGTGYWGLSPRSLEMTGFLYVDPRMTIHLGSLYWVSSDDCMLRPLVAPSLCSGRHMYSSGLSDSSSLGLVV